MPAAILGRMATRIGFDVTPLCVPQSGVGTYTSSLLEHLQTERHDEIVPLSHRRLDGSQPAARRGPLNKTIWMQTVLPWQIKRLNIELCHFTNSVAPLLAPCPTVVTIHDMTLWLFPQHHNRRRLASMRPLIPWTARRAPAVIAVSHSTKADIVRILGLPADKVHVIYEAPAPCFQPIPDGQLLAAVRRQYDLPDHFVLSVGTIEPRKNLVRLVEAFAELHRAGAIRHSLIFVGNRGWKDEPVFAAVERLGLSSAVHFLGYVPRDSLVALYNLADALVFPSLYEGFGLPVVEAMACGTPVITSRNGSLGEVAADAAEFVEPTAVASIAEGMQRVLTDAGRCEELRARGLARAACFSWSSAAAQTRELYAKVLSAS